ncbi:MAG: hypothetical protein JO286_14010 [Solirubrobacterales bacterium]|nr:hypothetical protein [Solirubrobacterales bacterium]MBV9808302.1 hypothetical protein [Solirubrobacterales bacterium]
MGLVDALTGGGRAQQDHQDLVGGRDDRGAPYPGISKDETVRRYDQIGVPITGRAVALSFVTFGTSGAGVAGGRGFGEAGGWTWL